MKYSVFSKTGTDHESENKENEDAGRIVVNGDYVFSIISDGAGSSDYAKAAAFTTVECTARFCFDNGAGLFDIEKRDAIAFELVCSIQKGLNKKAKALNTELENMPSTLVLLCLDTGKNEYVTIHIGDGLICKLSEDNTEIISYPENGVTKQYTYMVNAPDVKKHLRVAGDKYIDNTIFFSGTDGVFDKCYGYDDCLKMVKSITNDPKIIFDNADDMSYNIIEL